MSIPTLSAQTPPAPAPAPRSSPMLPIGALLLAVATVAASVLAYTRLTGLAAPGCGGGGGCDKLTKGVWGSLPWLHWPVSYTGAAYFAGMLIAWLAVRGRPTCGMRWLARLGALASLGFMGVMFSEGSICPYCLTAHIANLLFVVTSEAAGRGVGGPSRAGVPITVAAAAIVTAALGMAELRQHEENARSLAESIAQAQAGMNKKPGPTAPTGRPGASGSTGVQGATGVRGATGATPPTSAPGGGGFTGRYRLGPADAPIRIVMITDYQCPDCKHFEAQAKDILKERSNVSLSIKHFPFCTACNSTPNVPNLHPNACWAARAAETAGKLYGPSGFWKMHDWLFEHSGVFDDATFPPALESLGFEPVHFQQVMKEMDTLALVQADIKEAEGLGIHSTPMMFVNGVEIKGWGSDAMALKNTVDALAKQAPQVGATNDRPPSAAERNAAEANDIIDLWRNDKKTPAMAWQHRKNPWSSLPENTPINVQVWGDMLEPNTAEADKILRDMIVGRGDIRYEFRYFPFDQACNPGLGRTAFPLGCRAIKAAEAAGLLGMESAQAQGPEAAKQAGIEMYWKMHIWIMEHQKEFSDAALRAAAPGMGLNPDVLFAKMSSQEVATVVGDEAGLGFRIGIPEIPRIFVNGKLISKWNIPGQFILERVIQEALDREAAKAAGNNAPH